MVFGEAVLTGNCLKGNGVTPSHEDDVFDIDRSEFFHGVGSIAERLWLTSFDTLDIYVQFLYYSLI